MTAGPDHLLVRTPHGEGRLAVHHAYGRSDGRARATLLLSHGAGAGTGTADLLALARGLPPRGVGVALLEQPWHVAGRRLATAPPTLDDALLAAAALLDDRVRGGSPLVVGGRSAGARSAARSAVAAGAVGCVALSFPLHPPKRPDRSRLHELLAAGVPTLVLQGGRDALGTPAEFPDDLHERGVTLVTVPWADHSLRVPARAPTTPEQVAAALVAAVDDWLADTSPPVPRS